jgi:hypothetical protein
MEGDGGRRGETETSYISCLSRGILRGLFLPVFWPKDRWVNGLDRKARVKTYSLFYKQDWKLRGNEGWDCESSARASSPELQGKSGGWPSLSWTLTRKWVPHPSRTLRRVGGRRIALWDSPFTPFVPQTRFSPNPRRLAPTQARREHRNDNYSSANLEAPPPVLVSPDSGACNGASPPASSQSIR